MQVELQNRYAQASLKTVANLKSIAQAARLNELSRLSLPEIDGVVEAVGRIIPAGNVPGVILNGLSRLAGRKPPPATVKRDIGLLFKGLESALDKAVYATFFAGPAAVIWGYQHLLKLAGKDPEDSFPDGTWQFYVDYALREDSARHANETHGFDSALAQHGLQLSHADRIAAWVLAASECLRHYPELLANEWRERVYTVLLRDFTQHEPNAARYARLYQEWEGQRPYARGPDVHANEPYVVYRRSRFERFLEPAVKELSPETRRGWLAALRHAEAHDLPAYQKQMSILAYLEPGAYGETRVPFPLQQAQIGLILGGTYVLLSLFDPATGLPSDPLTVRAQVAALAALAQASGRGPLADLAVVRRAEQAELRTGGALNEPLRQELDLLRFAPILINGDRRPPTLPLAEIRQGERGVGDHALTLFDTGETMVFDQSHIFFDGGWGAALAEILTNEALAWAVYLHSLPPAQPSGPLPRSLALPRQADDHERIQRASRVAAEASAETTAITLKPILSLRKLFKQRSDLIQLTVNDLLVLYRALHAVTYQPDPRLLAELEALARVPGARPAAQAALKALRTTGENPAILIPVDASQRAPRERLYPMSFAVPLQELDFLKLHTETLAALAAYNQASGDRSGAYARFDQLQRQYLATLAGFGAVMSKAKEIAIRGESGSVGAMKLLAHMPMPLQRLLNGIPGRFDLLNDILKGREVFSNVGAVAKTSTLTRFITAKDDNEKKTLAWGVLTTAEGVMCVTLRDFRPHVALLESGGRRDLATWMTRDYLERYAQGVNDFIRDLHEVTRSSRETLVRARSQS